MLHCRHMTSPCSLFGAFWVNVFFLRSSRRRICSEWNASIVFSTVYCLLIKNSMLNSAQYANSNCWHMTSLLCTFNSDRFQKVFRICIQFCAKKLNILPQIKDMEHAAVLWIQSKLCLVLLFCLFITLEFKNEFERTALWDIVFHTEYCFSILHILAKIVGHLVISIQKICILCNVV